MKNTLTWSQEAPRVRPVYINNQIVMLAFPRMVFAVRRNHEGKFIELSAFASRTGKVETRPDDTLYSLSRGLTAENIAAYGGVCLGNSLEKIRQGIVDPVQAFWLTNFQRPDMEILSMWKMLTRAKVPPERMADGLPSAVGTMATLEVILNPATARAAINAADIFVDMEAPIEPWWAPAGLTRGTINTNMWTGANTIIATTTTSTTANTTTITLEEFLRQSRG